MAYRPPIEIDWKEVFDSRSSSPDRRTFYPGSAPAARAAPAARRQIKIDWAHFCCSRSSSPDRLTFYHPGTAPAARAAAEDDEPRRGASSRPHHPGAEDLPCRIERGAGGRRRHRAVPEAAAAEEDEHEGERSFAASTGKKSRKLDTEKQNAHLHMLGEINKSLQASLKPAEPLQARKETSPLSADTEKQDALLHMLGEINKSLQASLKPAEPLYKRRKKLHLKRSLRPSEGYPDWPVLTCCEAIVCLREMVAGSDLLWHSRKP